MLKEQEKIQLIEKTIATKGQEVRISESLDSDFKHLTGIAFLANIGLQCILKHSAVDGREFFPKDFEVAFLQTNIYVAPNERFLNLHLPAKGNRISIDFKDGGTAKKYPYQLHIYLRLSNAS